MKPEQEKACHDLAVMREYIFKMQAITSLSTDDDEFREIREFIAAYHSVQDYVFQTIRDDEDPELSELLSSMSEKSEPSA